MENFEIRRLDIRDLESCYANRLRALQDSPMAFLTTYEEEKARGNELYVRNLKRTDDENVIFGALINGEVVATVGMYREERPRTKHKATIWGVFVDPKYRGRGLAQKVLDLAIEHAREKMQAGVIYLSVEAGNAPALKLYESRGFKVWGREPRAMIEQEKFFDEDHMSLVL